MRKKNDACGVRTVLLPDGRLKAVVRMKKRGFSAELLIGGETVPDAFNDREPYDRKTHVFYLASGLTGRAELRRKRKKKNKRSVSLPVFLPAEPTDTLRALLEE